MYLLPCQTSDATEIFFSEIEYGQKSLTIFAKKSIIDNWQKYA